MLDEIRKARHNLASLLLTNKTICQRFARPRGCVKQAMQDVFNAS
jgi:hypothetical protein